MTRTLKLWISIAFVVVFLAGGAIGLFAGAVHARHVAFQHRGPHAGERLQQHFERELHLTPEQSAQIAPILHRTGTQLDAIRQETGARVTQTMTQAHDEIVPLLTPEQREHFEEMRRRHEQMMHRREGGPPPPPR